MKNLGDKIFSYTKLQLEMNVDRFLDEIPCLREAPPPILSEVVLEQIQCVKGMEAVPLLTTHYGVEAMVLTPTFMHREMIVVIDHSILNHRDVAPYNMAIAEEIGHIQLHRAVMLDIQEYQDFIELQAHPNWEMAERDAKYWGRALLTPRSMLETACASIYRRVVNELGFRNGFQIGAVITAQLAVLFEIPNSDAQKRIDEYVHDMRGRIERSIAARSERLLAVDDMVMASGAVLRQRKLCLFGPLEE